MTAPAGHPGWCSPRRCRIAIGGAHHSEPIQARQGETTVTAWLQRQPGEATLLGWTSAYRTIGGPPAWLPLPVAERLIAAVSGLVDHGLADEAGNGRRSG
jgi:hypothetical protein